MSHRRKEFRKKLSSITAPNFFKESHSSKKQSSSTMNTNNSQLEALKDLLNSCLINKDKIHYLSSMHGKIELILESLSNCGGNPEFEYCAVHLLTLCLKYSSGFEELRESNDACVLFIKVLNNRKCYFETKQLILESFLCLSDHCTNALTLANGGLIEIIQMFLRTHSSDTDTVLLCLKILVKLVKNTMQYDIIDDISKSLRTHLILEYLSYTSHEKISECTVYLIQYCSGLKSKNFRLILRQLHALHETYDDNNEITCNILMVINSLLMRSNLTAGLKILYNYLKTSSILLNVMSQHTQNRFIQETGLKIFIKLFLKKLQIYDLSESCSIILYAMKFHLTEKSIQLLGCNCIVVMSIAFQKVNDIIGEEDDKDYQFPFHRSIQICLDVFQDDCDIIIHACEAIYTLCQHNSKFQPRIQDLFFKKGIHNLLLSIFEKNLENISVVIYLCKALRAICSYRQDHCEMVLILNGYELVHKAFVRHRDPDFLIECIALIASLSILDTMKNLCILKEFHLNVIEEMQMHQNRKAFIEICFEALGNLVTATGAKADIANNLHLYCKIMKLYFIDSHIQWKGFVLLNSLIEKNFLDKYAVLYSQVAKLILDALNFHRNSKKIIKEVCTTMRLLTELSKRMGQAILVNNIEKILFNILDDKCCCSDIINDVNECLSVLCYYKEFRDEMLLNASKYSYNAVVCLIKLGADVNTIKNGKTPLIEAYSNNDYNIVRFLLQSGASEIEPILSDALKNGKEDFIALLLFYLGKDSENLAVNWSDLKLQKLRTTWLFETFVESGHSNSAEKSMVSQKGLQMADSILQVKDQVTKERKLICTNFPKTTELTVLPRYKIEDAYPLLLKNTLAMDIPDFILNETQNNVDYDEFLCKSSDEVFSTTSSSDSIEISEDLSLSTNTKSNIDFFEEIDINDASKSSEYSSDKSNDSQISSLCRRRTTSHLRTKSKIKSKKDKKLLKLRNAITMVDLSYHIDPDIAEWLSSYKTGAIPPLHPKKKMWEFVRQHRISDEEVQYEMVPNILERAKKNPQPNKHNFIVKSFDISSNELASFPNFQEMPEILNRFRYLEKLDLKNNKLHNIPDTTFSHLSSLTHIYLGDNMFSNFPCNILLCMKLVHIDLSNNKLISTYIPESYRSSLSDVRTLNLSNNVLAEFPLFLTKRMPGLTNLYLQQNKIRRLLNISLELPQLVVLNLSDNRLETIPEIFLSTCQSLQNLNLNYNRLKLLPEASAPDLKCLVKVELSNNQLIDKEPFYHTRFVLELPAVQSVNLSRNKLAGIAQPHLWTSKNLQRLYFSNNEIKSVEVSTNWKGLLLLHINGNQITEIPKGIGMLTNLTSFNFSNNPITSLPDEMGKLSDLFEMPREGLKLDLPSYLLKARTRDVIGFLHERFKSSEPYFGCKLMIVGYGSRGKTTLVKQLKREKVKPDESNMTLGVDVHEWRFDAIDPRTRQKAQYKLSCWDFAGQEDFYATHQVFMSQNALYLVVYRVNGDGSEISCLRNWLLHIHARAPLAPIIIVGTHIDKVPPQSLSSVITNFTSQIKDICVQNNMYNTHFAIELMEVNCLINNSKIEHLRNNIKYILENYKIRDQYVMGQKIPKSYKSLEKAIKHEKAINQKRPDWVPVLTKQKLLKIVKNANIYLDEDDLRHGIKFLHEIGFLLHYSEHSNSLSNLYFIDPQWLCEMMSKVVTLKRHSSFISDKGILKKSDLKYIYQETPYKWLLDSYIKFLEKFQIAVPLGSDNWLITCRLPPRHESQSIRTNEVRNFQTKKIQRNYELCYEPQGLWAFFISNMLLMGSRVLDDPDIRRNLKSTYPKHEYFSDSLLLEWETAGYNNVYLLVELLKKKDFVIIKIIVPFNKFGKRLLGQVVDCTDSLIEEWFPGFLNQNPNSKAMLEKLALCNECNHHFFKISQIYEVAELSQYINCPEHMEVSVKLADIAPDVVLGDLSNDLILNDAEFEFEELPENLLGAGQYGSVYRAKYKAEFVAVKLFKNKIEGESFYNLRQEVTIMRRIRHPSILSVVGATVRPKQLMLLEMAKCGSLKSNLSAGRIKSRDLQYKIALQITEGLEKLHSCKIIFRDLKPDNVLIFSLSTEAKINAKISDYGIARYVTETGLINTEGTTGYKAPEVIRKNFIYSSKADVYSLGATFYDIVTGGVHIYQNLHYQAEIDDAALQGKPVKNLASHGLPEWPDMEDIINSCLEVNENLRPSASQVLQQMRRPWFRILQRARVLALLPEEWHPICLEAIPQNENLIQVWIGSGNGTVNSAVLSVVEYGKVTSTSCGVTLQDYDVCCLLPISGDRMLAGTLSGNIWLIDTAAKELKHKSVCFPGKTIFCMKLLKFNRTEYVCIGLASGEIVFILENDLQNSSEPYPVGKTINTAELFQTHSLAVNLAVDESTLFCSIGSNLCELNLEILNDIPWGSSIDYRSLSDKNFKILKSDEKNNLPIKNLKLKENLLFFSREGSHILEIWNTKTKTIKSTINCYENATKCVNCKLTLKDTSIRCIYVHDANTFWVGLRCGIVIIYKTYQTDCEPKVIKRHYNKVSCIVGGDNLKFKNSKFSLVFSTGTGCIRSCLFLDPSSTFIRDLKRYSFLMAWRSDVFQIDKNMRDDELKRYNLL